MEERFEGEAALQVVADLKAVRELLARGWTQGAAARDAGGAPCGVSSPDATEFCVIGAMARLFPSPRRQAVMRALAPSAGDRANAIVDLNDFAPNGEAVLAWIDQAILAVGGEKP